MLFINIGVIPYKTNNVEIVQDGGFVSPLIGISDCNKGTQIGVNMGILPQCIPNKYPPIIKHIQCIGNNR